MDGNSDIWILDITRGILDKFTSHPELDSHPLWSPDGTRIVFQRFSDNRGDLSVKPVNGNGDEQLVLTNPRGKIPTDWSRDGEYILYKEGAGPQRQVGYSCLAHRWRSHANPRRADTG